MEKDEKGNIIMTAEELAKTVDDAATKAAEKLIKDAKLDQAPPPPANPPVDGQKFAEKEGETASSRRKRLEGAVREVKGGNLAVIHAPKEIKMIRFVKALWHRDDAVIKSLTEGTAEDGGNLVPVEFGTDLLVAIEEYGTVRRDSTYVPMTTNEKDLRTVTTKPAIYRKGELVSSVESLTKFGKPQLTVDRYIGHQIISLEELEDNNVDLYNRLIDLFAEQFGYQEDYEGLAGTYYPGVLNSVTPTTTTLASTSIASATYKELVKFKNSLSKGKLVRGGKFYMHRTILGVFEGMEDQQGRPIVTNPYGPQGANLFGFPVELNEAMPDLSTDAAATPFVIFGNLKWIAFGDRKGITAELLSEATMPYAGGTVNLAAQGAKALAIHNRWGLEVTIPGNLAILKTKAA